MGSKGSPPICFGQRVAEIGIVLGSVLRVAIVLGIVLKTMKIFERGTIAAPTTTTTATRYVPNVGSNGGLVGYLAMLTQVSTRS